MKGCVQFEISCDTETNADNCLSGIQMAVSAITSGWENERNKNSNIKAFNNINNRWGVNGIQRMSDETEKNTLITKIRALGNPPWIVGKVYAHKCSHFEWKCLNCGHIWEVKELSTCPNCGAAEWIEVDNVLKHNIISNAQPCAIEESWEL